MLVLAKAGGLFADTPRSALLISRMFTANCPFHSTPLSIIGRSRYFNLAVNFSRIGDCQRVIKPCTNGRPIMPPRTYRCPSKWKYAYCVASPWYYAYQLCMNYFTPFKQVIFPSPSTSGNTTNTWRIKQTENATWAVVRRVPFLRPYAENKIIAFTGDPQKLSVKYLSVAQS